MYNSKNHTFVVCAYKESIYLEEALLSLMNQTVPPKILIATSTPNDYIKSLAEKYQLPLYINTGESGIANDWNFAYKQAKTHLITICHQDDIYEEQYLEKVLEYFNKSKHPLICFTDYSEVRNGQRITRNNLLKIKRLLLYPLRFQLFWGVKWIRRRSLSLGNAICCPAVTFCEPNLDNPVFEQVFQSNVDWYAWEKISKKKGDFIYVPESLMCHRIHAESTTSEVIGDSMRTKEDYIMFCKFWPKWIAKRITKVYQKSEESNKV